jgi:hypothetical protein
VIKIYSAQFFAFLGTILGELWCAFLIAELPSLHEEHSNLLFCTAGDVCGSGHDTEECPEIKVETADTSIKWTLSRYV